MVYPNFFVFVSAIDARECKHPLLTKQETNQDKNKVIKSAKAG